jgi:hypothetical protein
MNQSDQAKDNAFTNPGFATKDQPWMPVAITIPVYSRFFTLTWQDLSHTTKESTIALTSTNNQQKATVGR